MYATQLLTSVSQNTRNYYPKIIVPAEIPFVSTIARIEIFY